jgi:hypothetical protein
MEAEADGTALEEIGSEMRARGRDDRDRRGRLGLGLARSA